MPRAAVASGTKDRSPPPRTPGFGYVFPAIRGVQARREYFVSMCPMRLLPRIFLFNEEELVPELRAQRILNKVRLPEMASYIADNRDTYVFSAITASIDGDVAFDALADHGEGQQVGLLRVPMTARFIINDGQHRRAAIEMALKLEPKLGDETIAVVFFLDRGLARCQQMFADLNRHAIRPSKSLGVLYDHRDDYAKLTKLVVLRSELFKDLVEFERSTLAQRSRKLFTLSALYTATRALLDGVSTETLDAGATMASRYWDEVAKHLPEWQAVRERKMAAAEVRREFLHSHGITLHALGIIGGKLLRESGKDWPKRLQRLNSIDWSRRNAELWEGRAMIGGRVSKSGLNVALTTAAIKQHLGLDLSPEEQRADDAFRRSRNGK